LASLVKDIWALIPRLKRFPEMGRRRGTGGSPHGFDSLPFLLLKGGGGQQFIRKKDTAGDSGDPCISQLYVRSIFFFPLHILFSCCCHMIQELCFAFFRSVVDKNHYHALINVVSVLLIQGKLYYIPSCTEASYTLHKTRAKKRTS